MIPRPGTRFRLFPQYAEGYAEPETVELSPPAGSLGPGPSDPAMYVADAVWKPAEYEPPDDVPPYRGAVFPPALPDTAGNFDWLPVETRQFMAAHLYGVVRFTLDVWEKYLGHAVVWWHAAFLPRLELIPVVQWDNAHSGPGFLETGLRPEAGRLQPFCLNFDVVSHETGHAILFAEAGVPSPASIHPQFLAFHESFADLAGMIAALHFRSVEERLLAETGGNLYLLNLLNRIGETSAHAQIRVASNVTRMEDVAALRLAADGGWIDPSGLGRNAHDLAQPLTGAVFDILVEIYQDGLVARRLIAPDDDPRGWTREEVAASLRQVTRTARGRGALRVRRGFLAALHDARDLVGACMAHVMRTVRPEELGFDLAAARFLEAAAARVGAAKLPALLAHFLWRGIDPRPFLGAVPAHAHASPRLRRRARGLASLPRAAAVRGCTCCDPRFFVLAKRMLPHRSRSAPAVHSPRDEVIARR